MRSIDEALRAARQAGVDRLDAMLLLGHVLRRDRTWLSAHGEQALTADQTAEYLGLLERRLDQVPMAYLLGQREFHGLTLRVTPDVLDPRPDTETLVDWALAATDAATATVVDLGTGSGAVALALKAARPGWSVCATDASAAALAVARANAEALGLSVEFFKGHWWEALADRRFDLAVSNPPYIAQDDAHLKALRHEPQAALVSGPHGLDDLRAIIEAAPAHLRPGGRLLLEHGHDQAAAVADLLKAAGFAGIEHRLDLAGHRRCTGASLAG